MSMDKISAVRFLAVLGPWIAAGAAGLLPAGCDDADDRRRGFLSGCKEDKDCPSGTVCENHNCRRPDPAKAAADAAARAKADGAARAAAAPPPADTADLVVRLCPGYWGKSQNTGTLIAKSAATGKSRYLRLNTLVEDEDFEDEFAFAALPYGRYEVTAFTGVVAEGGQDLLNTPCAERQPCATDGRTRLVDHGPPPPPEAWAAQLEQWQKDGWPGTEKCPKGHECDEAALLRRPCDFDVDRPVDKK